MFRLSKFAFPLMIVAIASGCQGGARMVSLSKPSIHVASTRVGAFLLPAEYRALHPELEKLFNQPVVFDPYISGADIGKQLASGRAQFAVLTAREFADIPTTTKLEMVAAGQNSTGKVARQGLIVAKSSSPIQTIAECKGQRFCFGPKGELLLDYAALATLEANGVQPSDLKKELPPLSLDGRLHSLGGSADVAKLVAFDGGISCGVVDEVTFNSLPDSGGSLLSGPSKDQLRVLGKTEAVPEIVVVASPQTDPAKVQLLREYLLTRAKNNAEVCSQMGVTSFAAADETLYADARKLLQVK